MLLCWQICMNTLITGRKYDIRLALVYKVEIKIIYHKSNQTLLQTIIKFDGPSRLWPGCSIPSTFILSTEMQRFLISTLWCFDFCCSFWEIPWFPMQMDVACVLLKVPRLFLSSLFVLLPLWWNMPKVFGSLDENQIGLLNTVEISNLLSDQSIENASWIKISLHLHKILHISLWKSKWYNKWLQVQWLVACFSPQ